MAEKDNILIEVFKLHHAQLQHRREKIHRTSTGISVAIYAIVAARYYLTDAIPDASESLISFAIIVLAIGAIGKLFLDGRAYVEILSVIKRINVALGLYDEVSLLNSEAVYPKRWKDGVRPTAIETVSFHCVFIALSASIGVAMILLY